MSFIERSKIKALVVFVPVLIMASILIGCGSSGGDATNPEETSDLPPGVTIKPIESTTPPIEQETPEVSEDLDIDKAETVMSDFLSATDWHIKGEYSSVATNGMKDGPTPIEIWKKGEKIRIDDTRSNGPRSLIVSDGKALYYMYNSKNIIPALMPAGHYTDLLGQDFSKATSQISGDGKSAVFSIDIDTFYKNDNAQAGYYVTKIEYSVDNDSVLNQVVYGKDSYGSKPSAVNTVTQTFSLVEVNQGVDDTVFNAPF